MKPLHTYLRFPALILFLLFLAACSESENHATKSATIASLDVYKSRTCQCCQQWVHHMEDVGFDTETHHPSDLNRIKNDYGITPEFQSCHTAVSSDGYVFEGHIPARFVQQFLENPPDDAIGLSVPGMPAGSPGMEMGDRKDHYKVILFNEAGQTRIFSEHN